MSMQARAGFDPSRPGLLAKRELKLKRYLVSILISLVSLGISAAAAQDRPRIIVVTYPLQYITERLVEGVADVVFPVPAGVDPSFWRPALSDIRAIQQADLVFLNGAGFASWVDQVSLRRSKVVNTSAALADKFIATQSITHSHGDGGHHAHDGVASYLWLDPALTIGQAEAVAAALAGRGLVDPAEVYARLTMLRADLEALNTMAQARLRGMQDTVFVSTHPRYQYFGRAFDVTIHALEWDAGATPTDAQLADLAALVADTGAEILLWEAQPSPAAFAATKALGLTNITFPPLAQQVQGADYPEAMRAAIEALSAASAEN